MASENRATGVAMTHTSITSIVVSAQVVDESDIGTETPLSPVKLGFARASGSNFLDRRSGE